jgi:hypothetical protein
MEYETALLFNILSGQPISVMCNAPYKFSQRMST